MGTPACIATPGNDLEKNQVKESHEQRMKRGKEILTLLKEQGLAGDQAIIGFQSLYGSEPCQSLLATPALAKLEQLLTASEKFTNVQKIVVARTINNLFVAQKNPAIVNENLDGLMRSLNITPVESDYDRVIKDLTKAFMPSRPAVDRVVTDNRQQLSPQQMREISKLGIKNLIGDLNPKEGEIISYTPQPNQAKVQLTADKDGYKMRIDLPSQNQSEARTTTITFSPARSVTEVVTVNGGITTRKVANELTQSDYINVMSSITFLKTNYFSQLNQTPQPPQTEDQIQAGFKESARKGISNFLVQLNMADKETLEFTSNNGIRVATISKNGSSYKLSDAINISGDLGGTKTAILKFTGEITSLERTKFGETTARKVAAPSTKDYEELLMSISLFRNAIEPMSMPLNTPRQ
jgi:hypothetical protein